MSQRDLDPRVVALVERQLPGMSDLERLQGWRLLERRLGERKRRWPWLMVPALAGAAVLFLARPWAEKPLGYQISEPAPVASAPREMTFSDGSRVTLEQTAQGRVLAVGPRGANLRIEDGRAEVHVVPRPGNRWRVEAGPFVIAVKGTEFSVDWSRARGRLEVHLRRGRVSVSGPRGDGPVELQAGQRLIADVPKAEMRVLDETTVAAPAPASAPVREPTSRPRGAPPRVALRETKAPEPTPAAAPLSWGERLRTGQGAAVVAEAESLGLDQVLRQRSSADLTALADAARYARRTDVARRALLAQRARFPGTAAARDAAFFLGRLTDGQAALTFYNQYLVDAPGGTYVEEALARKMDLTARLGDSAGARAIAEDYLRRFPSGTYRDAARALVR